MCAEVCIPLESIPAEYTVMYIPFSERYRYPILIGSILGAVFVLTVIVLLSFSLLRERRRKREALRNLLYEHETLCLAIEGNSTYAWRLEGDSVSCDSQFCELIHHRSGRLLLNEITPYIHPGDLPVFRKNIASRHERTHHKGQYRCNFTGEFQWWEFSYNTIHTPRTRTHHSRTAAEHPGTERPRAGADRIPRACGASRTETVVPQ